MSRRDYICWVNINRVMLIRTCNNIVDDEHVRRDLVVPYKYLYDGGVIIYVADLMYNIYT